MRDIIITIPAVALRGMTILPGMIAHFDISRKSSSRAVECAMTNDSRIFLVTQKEEEMELPTTENVYRIGVLAEIRQIVKLQDGVIRVMVEGKRRAELLCFTEEKAYLEAEILCFGNEAWKALCPDTKLAMTASVKDAFARFGKLYGKFGAEVIKQLMELSEPEQVIDFVTNNMPVPYQEKQQILETIDPLARHEEMLALLMSHIRVFEIKQEFQDKVRERVDKHQKDYLLREQLGVIREELGENTTDTEADEFRKAVEALCATEEVKAHINKEIKRFTSLSGSSSESAVVRGYIETLLELPWDKKSQDNLDLKRAEAILDEDHYGLEKVKERILEFLAVRALTGKGESPIICLVGPPGTGKTSIAKSVARALDKEYVRICLGGVRDEAEIRGHRKTYVGAMPGRIITGLKKAGVSNPLMLLDEIDKVSNDYKGDTAAALLEVLDAEQNNKFRDHYVELPVDLSEVLFIATANSLDTISKPLLDRMEVIELSSYTQTEKLHIAKNYLVKKQLEKNGIPKGKLKISDTALKAMILNYTREAGVRNLERKIGDICRKSAKKLYEDETLKLSVSASNLEEYLGKEKYRPEKKNKKDEIGIVRGLAWTSVGGVTLEVEVNVMPGKGECKLTGKLGDVMKESAQAALSCVRSMADRYQVEDDFFEKHDIHVHIPEGAVPKDGPSAGITMATAILSAVAKIPVRANLAMTGEITLRGRVLPIGGLKEKMLAAKNANITTICYPKDNEKDVEEISEEIKDGIKLIPVTKLEEVLEVAFHGN